MVVQRVGLAAGLSVALLVGCSGGGGTVSSRQEPQQPAAVSNNAAMPAHVTPAVTTAAPTLRLPGIRDLALRGKYVYVLAADGLVILDVTKPATPEVVSRLNLPRNPLRLALDGDVGYVACGPGGLQVLDLAKPKEPALAATYAPTNGGVELVAAGGGHLVVSLGANGLAVLEPRGAAAPLERKLLPTPKNVKDLRLKGDRAYALTDRLTVIAVAKPAEANALGTYTNNAGLQAFAFAGEQTLTWGAGGLGLVDLRTLERPVNGPELTNADLLKAWPPLAAPPAAPKTVATAPPDPTKAPEVPLRREDRLRVVGQLILLSRTDGQLGLLDLLPEKPPVPAARFTKLDGPGAFDVLGDLLVVGTAAGELQTYTRGEQGFALSGTLALLGAPTTPPPGAAAASTTAPVTPPPPTPTRS